MQPLASSHCRNLLIVLAVCSVSPGSLGTCDSFLNVFQNKGLRREVVCPYASSVEATTVSVRRSVSQSLCVPVSSFLCSLCSQSKLLCVWCVAYVLFVV